MTVSYGTKARAKATKLHSKIIRSLGYCQRCGRAESLQCAHIVRRTYSWTRTDLRNAWCLCAKCHFHLDNNPDEFMAFVVETIGLDLFHELKNKALAGVGKKFDWPSELERLQSIAVERDVV